MARKPRTPSSVHQEFGVKERLAAEVLEKNGRQSKLDRMERLSAVLEMFCQGMPIGKIQEQMEKRYGAAGKLNREAPYALIRYAAAEGWLAFTPPSHFEYAEQLRTRFDWLRGVSVVNSIAPIHVAASAAATLRRLVESKAQDGRRDVVHIGFSGGPQMRLVASEFAQVLAKNPAGLPKKIALHSMVSGFDYDPTTDPNSFVTYFLEQPTIQVEFEFVGFRVPPIVTPEQHHLLAEIPEIKRAMQAAELLDIVVTSGADCPDHSSLQQSPARHKESGGDRLEDRVVDLMWRPMKLLEGPIVDESSYRAMTVMDLGQLPQFIARGNSVLLMVAPCWSCNRPKNVLLRVVLGQKMPYVSHIVTDVSSASALLKEFDPTHPNL